MSVGLSEEQAKLIEERNKEIAFGVHRLGSDIDRDSLADDLLWLVGKTALQPVVFGKSEDEKRTVLLLPLREFRMQQKATKESQMTAAWFGMTRIRSYVSYSCQKPIPMSFRAVSMTLLFPWVAHRSSVEDAVGSFAADALYHGLGVEEIKRRLNESYDRATILLSLVRSGTFLDRAITHFGEAYWGRDLTDRFFQLWKAVEAVADMDFHNTRNAFEESLQKTMSGYMTPEELDKLKIRSASVKKIQRINATARQRAADVSEESIEGLESLRNAIAHGEVTEEKFQAITDRLDDMTSIATKVVGSALGELVATPSSPSSANSTDSNRQQESSKHKEG